MKKHIISFSPPYIDETIINEVIDTLYSGWITTGPKVKAFEEEIKKHTGVDNVLCVNSWTSGAIMILKWLGLKEGDEIIIPSYTYSATALAVMHNNAKPVMVDVDESFAISVDKIRKAITPKTKAIIPVDFGGWPCDYEAILKLVNTPEVLNQFVPDSEIQHQIGRIMIIGDCAHSFGATQEGNPVTCFPDISIYSFHAVKNLTTAEGGAICLNLPEPFNNLNIYKYLKMMTLNGQTKDAYSKSEIGSWKYDIVMKGLKINMPDICAAIGLAQIRKYDFILRERKRIYKLYSELFRKFTWAQLPPQDTNKQTSSYHLYALRIRNVSESQRDMIINVLSKAGIAVNVHFIPLPMLTLFKDGGYQIQDFPMAYDNYSREISLPIYPQLTNVQIEYIVKKIVEAYNFVVNEPI